MVEYKKDGRKQSPILKLSSAEWDRIVERVRSGEARVPAIAEEEGVSARTLQRQCRKRGVCLTGPQKVAENIEEARRLYEEEYLPQAMIAAVIGVDVSSLRREFVRRGVPIRPQGYTSRVVRPDSPLEKALVLLYKQYSLEDLESLTGIGVGCIKNALKRVGVPLRPRGGGSHIKRKKG